jgi:hypothetical protein
MPRFSLLRRVLRSGDDIAICGGLARRGQRRRRVRSAHLESLEARQLLAADGLTNEPVEVGSAGDLSVTAVAAQPPTFECPAALERISTTPLLPAPIMADYNLDGDFTSEDFVAFFHYRIHSLPEPSLDESYDISEDFDLVESMQWAPYETKSQRDATHPCAIYEVARITDPTQVAREDRYAEDGTWVQESTIRIGPHNRPNYRAAAHYDPEGRLRTFTLNLYRAGAETVYSRMHVEYDAASRVVSHLTWIYGDNGRLRRSTTSNVFYLNDQDYRSTRVEYFDDDGELTSDSIRYYNGESREVATETTEYEDGLATRVIRARYDRDGRTIAPTPLTDPDNWTSKYAPQSPQSTYLREVEDAFRATSDTYGEHYRDVLRMNRLPSQENLEDIIDALQLGSAEANYYRQLNQYFSLSLDLARAMQQQEFSQVYDRYSTWIDSTTGDWTPGFREFVQQERLTLPLPPLRLNVSEYDVRQSDSNALTNQFRETFGDNPTAYFQAAYHEPKAHVRDLLESMRFVKAQIKLQEYKVVDKFPTYERIIAQDQPDRESLGLREGILLTGWYFFERGEDGAYKRDEVSPEVIRKRVLNSLTDEDTFYAMNLEHWELDGPPEVINASLKSLKRAADLIHESNPNLLIGYYRLIPQRRPHATDDGIDSVRYQAWRVENDRIAAALEDSVDVIFPSLYVLLLGNEQITTEERWKEFATESVNEAKRLGGGKPVVPYVALYYHRNGTINPKAWTMIEPELLLYQLATISTMADGVLLYDDLHRNWDAIEDSGLDEAIELFREAIEHDAVPQLLQHYDDVLARNHYELIEKLKLEKQLGAKQQELDEATTRKDARLAASLVRDINLLEYQLRNKINIWPEIKEYLTGIL